MKSLLRVLFCTLLLGLANCVGPAGQIGSNLTLCCPGNYETYRSYSIQTQDVPVFLRDYLVAEFDVAFGEKGLRRMQRNADLQVTLAYNHINLRTDQEVIDPFVRIESMNTEISYIAAIDIEMREVASGDLVWAGSINRAHHVAPGEYMHEEGARPAFQEAFRNLLSSYPPLTAPD